MRSLAVLFFIMSAFFSITSAKEIRSWPIIVEDDKKNTITIYQPQVEHFTDNTMEARAAVKVKTKEHPKGIFGAMWFICRGVGR